MSVEDQRIGSNVAALRGEMTQQSVADVMRARGYKWSQATVWSVEKGDRPLRLVEASDLADAFGVPLSHFFYTESETNKAIEFTERVDNLKASLSDMTYAINHCLSARDVVRQVIEAFGDVLDPEVVGGAEKLIALSDPVAVARHCSKDFENKATAADEHLDDVDGDDG